MTKYMHINVLKLKTSAIDIQRDVGIFSNYFLSAQVWRIAKKNFRISYTTLFGSLLRKESIQYSENIKSYLCLWLKNAVSFSFSLKALDTYKVFIHKLQYTKERNCYLKQFFIYNFFNLWMISYFQSSFREMVNGSAFNRK